LLDPNHTHFILVDDGSEGLFGKEIEFRAHLEAELRKGKSLRYYEKKFKRKRNMSDRSSTSNSRVLTDFEDDNDEEISRNESVPMVLIVVQGGPNTLLTVEESLKQNVPVLVLAVS
jgi:transient receptor potential cation channel subfamily M member 2